MKARSAEVLKRIAKVAQDLQVKKAQLGILLLEATTNKYYKDWGYNRFDLWLEDSDLGISSREAYYYIEIAKKAAAVGLGPEVLDNFPVSHLKAIFSLDPKEDKEIIEDLVAATRDGASLSDIKEAVRDISGIQKVINLTTAFRSERVKSSVEKTIEAIRQRQGFSTNGEAIEFLCKEYKRLVRLEER